jgi:hypothetical protein
VRYAPGNVGERPSLGPPFLLVFFLGPVYCFHPDFSFQSGPSLGYFLYLEGKKVP